jgi:AraC family transcriptional regulator of adaptative response/methylated-DNA-[protein]-cysteine methyltransferase
MNLELLTPPRDEMERAFQQRDASYDGLFFCAVRTTGIFCRPSCPSRPKLEHVEFFPNVRAAIFAGYRPCKRCAPLATNGEPPAWVAELQQRVENSPDCKLQAGDLRVLGISPERARRWFLQHYGMTFVAWCRGRRLANAFTQIREGAPLDDVILSHGYESHSGFREAFGKTFGKAPGRSRAGERVVTAMIESPLGLMIAGTTEQGICLLEFTDRRMLETNFETVRQRYGCAVVPGDHARLTTLRAELAHYFAGELREFTVPIDARGTDFQERVWAELRRIPHGATISYDDLAQRIAQPRAFRAVARANGTNRVCILIPCHRVIAKDGTLSGYGGGVWRKRLLLDLEREGRLPQAG